MNHSTLGRLQRVDLREIWKTEAQDFTPWLAREEKLAELADTIKMDLELEAQEKNVGPFRADILCRNVEDGSWVLVENQLERTDHIHLGQLLTYASGLEAVTIVWVAAQFTEEHRATLDWLNDITDEKFRFFGLEFELWRIGESPVAPKFNIVSKPNDWSRSISQAARAISQGELTETKALQLEYWTGFRQYLIDSGSPLRPQKPYPQHWANYVIGRAGLILDALLNSTENRVGVGLYINDVDAKAYFWLLHRQKDEIERELGFALDWLELPERKGCRMVHYWEDTDPLDRAKWPQYYAWMRDKLERLDRVLRPRIRALDASDWTSPGGEEPPD